MAFAILLIELCVFLAPKPRRVVGPLPPEDPEPGSNLETTDERQKNGGNKTPIVRLLSQAKSLVEKSTSKPRLLRMQSSPEVGTGRARRHVSQIVKITFGRSPATPESPCGWRVHRTDGFFCRL